MAQGTFMETLDKIIVQHHEKRQMVLDIPMDLKETKYY